MERIKKFALLIVSLVVFTTAVFAFASYPSHGWDLIIKEGDEYIIVPDCKGVGTVSAIAVANDVYHCRQLLINYGYNYATFERSTNKCILFAE